MKDKLKDLYGMYQFQMEEDTGKCLVFSYRMGIFRNIEIVGLKDTSGCRKEMSRLESDYRAAGWDSINTVFYATSEEAEKKLFDSFFYLEESRRRLKEEYGAFCKLQTRKLKNPYSYIKCNYCSMEEKEIKGLVEHVTENAGVPVARLTILEAAAGYGKTCTVYEILNRLVNCYPEKIPLFIELSKNRMANIFLYVLSNEINEKFTQLKDELVIQEIKEGRIPLIIDGFDELIQWRKSVDAEENPDEQSLTMLSTIADLLGEDSKAWILLTSRRSAIFTGDIFEDWVLKKLGQDCVVERLQILKPSVKEWIGDEKYKCICESRIAIENISNPVLLIWIQNQSLDEVKKLAKDEETILSTYFKMLLEREETRQWQDLPVQELYRILEKLAADFVQFGIMSESRDFIEELLYEILQENLMKYRTEYRAKYGDEVGMLSNENYIGRISNNSLLDRVSMTDNRIGFINEFVMGILVGDAVCDGLLQSSDFSEKFIDISVTAFFSRGQEKRREYYGKIKDVLKETGGQCRLNAELSLLHKNQSNYEDEYFSGIHFQKYYRFDPAYKFKDCIFSSCIFDQCMMNAEVFENVKFFNCQFFEVTVEGTAKECVFLGCTGCEELERHMDNEIAVKEQGDKYEKIILEQFWKPGYKAAELRRTYTALFKGVNSSENHNIEVALKSLLKKGLVKELNICYEMNISKINEIKRILGR